MELAATRAGPYVRALRAAVDALAPDEDHVPLRRALAHLDALDPATSGDLLFPAETAASGMPAYPWLERARAEQALARRGQDPTEDEVRRAAELDPALAERMRARRELHRLLREVELLPSTELTVATRSFGPTGGRLALSYDRIAPDARWLRVRLELEAPARPSGLSVDRGRATADEALRHLLTRHFAVPLPALAAQVAASTGCRVRRVSRGWTGPFWFRGVELPPGVPRGLGEGLLLHLSVEVLGAEVGRERSVDPLHPRAPEAAPEGLRWFLGRRVAAAGLAHEAAVAWLAERGLGGQVVPFGPRPG